MKAKHENSLSIKNLMKHSLVKVFLNWKKALSKNRFVAHEHSNCHQEAVTRSISAPSCSYGKIPEMMLTSHEKSMQENRQMFLKIL